MDYRVKIFLFDDEQLTKTVVETYLADTTFNFMFAQYDEYNEDLIENSECENIVIVNINKYNSEILESISKISRRHNNYFIIISYDNDTDMTVQAIRAGAEDFIPKPLTKTDFLYVLHRIYKVEIQNKKPLSESKIYTAVSAEPSVGKTFFLINFAEQIAEITNEKVLIVDFNNSISDVSMKLDLDIEYNLPWFLNNLTSENAEEIFSKSIQYKNLPLYIIASGVLGMKVIPQDDKTLSLFFSQAKKMYKYILVDLDSNLAQSNKFVKCESDSIFVIVNAQLASVNKTREIFYCDELVNEKGLIILNKCNERINSKLHEFESLLQKEIYWKLPNSTYTTSVSARMRQTVKEINPEMDIVCAYKNLANHILNKD